MTCDLLVDGDVETTVTALNNVTATISVQNVSEGRHEWAVRCTDLAGWDNVSETRRYILDRTAPEALLTSPPRLVMKSGVTLNFAVTDNFGLDGVTYSYSNFSVDNPNYEYVNLTLNKSSYASVNETQFAIETVLWEEGDHDITIWADDIASNNGTGFYFITIDNTAPLINLLSPLNESVTDATFVFNTSDNTDDAVECTLYVNETARGSSSVNNSITPNGTIRASLIQGTYQWRVECIDDAGNNGASETWNITIIDLTGPEITFNDVGTVIRGNDIIVNATISDISGVDESSVQASIEDANNITSNITLQRVTGTDSYVGVYPTNSTFPLGTYIARVSAEDVFGNQNSNYSDYGLTYGYVVNLILNPNPAQTGQQVTASGTVSYDNGEIANDGFITLMLPDTSIDVVIENGGFSHMFNAPGVAALYGVIATITPENGFTFSAAGMLNVTNETQAENTTTTTTTTTSSNNGGSGSTSDFGRCGVNKVEDENGRCVDITESDTPTEIVSLPEQSQGDENSNSGVVTFGSCGDGSCDQNENPHNCALDCGEPEKTAGVGKAGGFLNLSSINSSLLWLMLVLLIVAFVLLYLYQYGAPEPSMPSISAPKMPKFSLFKKKDHLGIDKYMENRNKP
ncbi:hypothetical protein COV19_02785 [Candidatus Woesearchaeota archaeon CG10_big_fil_rev_8_21_14_0_10_44_13]|nr:MAG: hypothetical protein COV19_02785 [Candidatus Woesearchaeota archaeon CG10_big_fil_rev_8_21_14_0_10_44_13]